MKVFQHYEDEYIKLVRGLRGNPPNERQKYAVYVQLDGGVKEEDKVETNRFADLIFQAAGELSVYVSYDYFISDYKLRMVEVEMRTKALKRQVIAAALPKEYLDAVNRIGELSVSMVVPNDAVLPKERLLEVERMEDACRAKNKRTFTRDDYQFFLDRFLKECYEGGYYLYECDSCGKWGESAWDIKPLLFQAIEVIDTMDAVQAEYNRCCAIDIEIIERAKALIERMKRGSLPQIFIDDTKKIIDAAEKFSKLMDAAMEAAAVESERIRKEEASHEG